MDKQVFLETHHRTHTNRSNSLDNRMYDVVSSCDQVTPLISPNQLCDGLSTSIKIAY